jgi:xanthine dehydrogenase YagR molybdenum-binding subunit
LSLGDEAIAAVALAREARAPVRVVLSREEELSVTGYRPATHIHLALLPDANGNLDALSIHARAHAGVAVNSTIAGLARLIYPARAKELVDYDVVTHQPPGSPFRGPGGPALCFALEQGVDEAARRLAVDPIALRQRWDPDQNRQRLYRWAASVPTWTSPRMKNGERMCRGVGVAAANWLYWYEPGLSVRLAVRAGRLVVSTGTQDMGTGSRTVLARTVAAEFDIAPWQVDVQLGDSSLPNGPLSGGSRTTATLVPATLRACAQLKVLLGSPSEGANWEQRIQDAPDMEVTAQREPDGTRGDAVSPLDKVGLLGTAFDYVLRLSTGLRTGRGSPGAVVVTEIEVDTQLGHVQVLRAHVGLAVGRIRAPELARSQVCGAVIQGVGHALHEERQVDPTTGLTLTAGLEDYRIPGLAETPEIDVHFDEAGFEHVDGGGVGLGEVAALAVAASIANAVRDATGRRPFQLPLRPDRMIGLLEDGAS